MPVSDTLSRSHLTHSELELTKNKLIHHVHFVLSNLPIIKTRSKQFQLVTTIGPILQTLITYSWVPNRRPTPLINFSMFFHLVHFYSKIFECLLFSYWIIFSILQPMNDQQSNSYPQIYFRIMPTTVMLHCVNVSFWKMNESWYPLPLKQKWNPLSTKDISELKTVQNAEGYHEQWNWIHD